MYARDYASTSYSPLSEIKAANVSQLRQVCSYQVPENVTFESSLVVVNGAMYFTTGAWTYALNAADCSLRWRVQYEGGGGTVRGVAIAGNRLFRGFRDGAMVAYDINDGRQIWIDGEFIHSVRKSPRFAEDEESVSEALPIPGDELEVAHAAVSFVKEALLYARVDLARDPRGQPMVMELELIEPSLYLLQSPVALERLVAAIKTRLDTRG